LNKLLDGVIQYHPRRSSSPASKPEDQNTDARDPSARPFDPALDYFKCLKMLRKDGPDTFIAIKTEESFMRWKRASPDLPEVYKRIDQACRVASASTPHMAVSLHARDIYTGSGACCRASIFVVGQQIRFDLSASGTSIKVAQDFISAVNWDNTLAPAKLVTVLELAIRLEKAKRGKLSKGPITVALNAEGGVVCSKWYEAIGSYL
jgi:hypothetical protein